METTKSDFVINIILDRVKNDLISQNEKAFLLTNLDTITDKFSDKVAEYRDELDEKNHEELIEAITELDLDQEEIDLVNFGEVEEKHVFCELKMTVKCRQCKEEFEETYNDYSLQFPDDLSGEISNLNSEGMIQGNEKFYCNDCIAEILAPFVDRLVCGAEEDFLDTILQEFLDNNFQAQQQEKTKTEAEEKAVEFEMELAAKIQEEEKNNNIQIDKRVFARTFATNTNLINLSVS